MLHLFFLLIRDRAEAVLSGYKQCHSAFGHCHCLQHCRWGGQNGASQDYDSWNNAAQWNFPCMFCNRCTNQMYNIDCRCLSWTTKSMQKQHWGSLPRLNYFISNAAANIMLHPGGQPRRKSMQSFWNLKMFQNGRHFDSKSCALQFPNLPCICKTITSSILSTTIIISDTYRGDGSWEVESFWFMPQCYKTCEEFR